MDMAFIPGTAELPLVRNSFVENIWLMVWIATSGHRASVGEGGLRAGVWPGSFQLCVRTRSLGRVSREEPWAESSVRDPLRQRPAPNQDTGSASETEKETGWQEGDEWLPSNQGRTQGFWRAEVQLTPDLRSRIRRWTTPVVSPPPPADTVPQGSLWGS